MEQEYLEVEIKVQDLKCSYEAIAQELEATQGYIKEVEGTSIENENRLLSLVGKFKRLVNSFSTSCLVQTIAILFCVFIILLLKL